MAAQRVLLAHENADFRKIYGSVLQYEGYEVVSTTDGDEAIRLLTSMPCDLVVSDLYLRSEIDECVVRRVRREPATSHLPIIVLTSWATEPHRGLALDEGADIFFALPVSPKHFASVVRDLLSPKTPSVASHRVARESRGARTTPLL